MRRKFLHTKPAKLCSRSPEDTPEPLLLKVSRRRLQKCIRDEAVRWIAQLASWGLYQSLLIFKLSSFSKDLNACMHNMVVIHPLPPVCPISRNKWLQGLKSPFCALCSIPLFQPNPLNLIFFLHWHYFIVFYWFFCHCLVCPFSIKLTIIIT